jgi:Putative exonuclease SbcCD, C subunit/P-loop containing region of AAA domain
MFLKKFVFVNWGNVPNCDFDIGPVSLFSGANGSGKTTAADAIQTVMTAAHENLFHYNPGQDESTQRGRGGKRVRTLASYVLGCDDGSYARTEPTDGYIAAVFHPTQQETAEVFTAVVGVRAWLDRSGKQSLAQEDQSLFLILPGAELGMNDFIKSHEGIAHIVEIDQIHSQLVSRLGKRMVERYDQKRAYLRRLYGALRGKVDSVSEREALAAARAFSRFMAYKPISSINQFVADEVLDRKDLGEAVRSVSSQLKTIHGMEREAQDLKDSAQLLEKSGHFAQSYIESWIDLRTLGCSTAIAGLLEWETQHQKKLAEREATERELAATGSRLELAAQRHTQLRATVISLEAQRQGIPALQRKDALEKERDAVNGKFAGTAAVLLSQDQKVQRNLRSVQSLSGLLALPSVSVDLPQVATLESQMLLRKTAQTAQLGDLDLPRYLQMDLTNDLALLEGHLDLARIAQHSHNELYEFWRRREAANECHRDKVADAGQLRRQRYASIAGQLQTKRQEIERLEAKQVVYPAYVDRALAAIRGQCPQADARVLCDHIEVTDARWQAAIEGFMGGARFSIMVDADCEAQAIRIVRALPGRDNKARVIQGAKALRDAARSKPLPESIVHALVFSHKIAEAYVMASFGSVARVKSDDDLTQAARGVTADGKASANYSMFRCDMPDGDLVFGAFARERALKARRAEVAKLETERSEANARVQELARLLEAVDDIAPLTYADSLAELLTLHRDLRRIEMLLTQLDTSAFESLSLQLNTLRREEEELRELERRLNNLSGELQARQADFSCALQALGAQKADALAAVAKARDELAEAHRHWPEFDLPQRLAHAEQEAKADQARMVHAADQLDARLKKSEHDLTDTIQIHNQKCRAADAIVFKAFNGRYDAVLFQQTCELRREIDRVFNILKNNVLVAKHEQLKVLKTSFNDAFVSHLCQEIHQAIQDGKRQLELLNKELISHRFGSDREQFRFAQEWVPEYREYARFFDEVVRSPSIGAGSSLFEAALSVKSTQTRDLLMSLLLGADEKKSLSDLDRIADYRNYHRYEIYKEVEGKEPIALSEYGTGSGGQLETPAYIIRAASITSALRYAEGDNHLRMVLVDEAFSKMDESRSREVIDYLTGSLGLQLIFIMPTSKCGPFMDLISNEFVFAKVPSGPRGQLLTRVLVDRKECNRERIADLWKRHRRTVRQQAELDFMSEVSGAAPDGH